MVNPQVVPVVIRVVSKEVEHPVEETANPLHCLSEILVLTPKKAASSISSQSVVPLRLLESPWAMTVDPRVLPMLSLSPTRVL